MRPTILDRKDLYFCVVGQRVIETHCVVIYQDQINLRVRNATRLDNVFYRRFLCEPPFDY